MQIPPASFFIKLELCEDLDAQFLSFLLFFTVRVLRFPGKQTYFIIADEIVCLCRKRRLQFCSVPLNKGLQCFPVYISIQFSRHHKIQSCNPVLIYPGNGPIQNCIFLFLFLFIGLVFLLDNAGKRNTAGSWILAVLGLAAVFLLTEILPGFLPGTDYGVDYGFFGVLLPVTVYLGRKKQQKFVFFSLGTAALAAAYGGIQWYSLLALPLLMLYNGQRGKAKLKNLFYLYYPAHLVALQLVAMFI